MRLIKRTILVLMFTVIILASFSSKAFSATEGDVDGDRLYTKNGWRGIGSVIDFALEDTYYWDDSNTTPWRDNFFCVQYGIHDADRLRLKSHFKIDGKQYTSNIGKSGSSDNAARLAFIASFPEKKEFKPGGKWGTARKVDGAYEAGIRHIAAEFSNQIGGVGIPCYSAFDGNPDTGHSDYYYYVNQVREFYEATENYVANVGKVPEDKTDKSKIRVTGMGDKVRIGPFKWVFPGNMNESVEVELYQDKNKTKKINNFEFATYEGTELKTIQKNEISNKDIYLLIPTSEQPGKLEKIVIKYQELVCKADLWFWEALEGIREPEKGKTRQGMLYLKGTRENQTKEMLLDYDISIFSDIKIVKKDTDNKNVPLKDVKFYIKNNEGKYVKQNGNEVAEYIDESEAFDDEGNLKPELIYTTNSDGEIIVKNLLIVYQYTAYELENPNYGYLFKEDKQIEMNTEAGTVVEYEILNIKQTGNLNIYKEDETTGKRMEDIGFKIKYIDGEDGKENNGKYIIVVNGGEELTRVIGKIRAEEIRYTGDINEATEFITDTEGITGIYNIYTGKYEVIETSIGRGDDDYINPYYHYYEVDDNFISWEEYDLEEGTTNMVQKQSGKGNGAQIDVTRKTSDQTGEINEQYVTKIVVKNRRKLVDLEGFVWEDRIVGKGSTRDNKYVENQTGRKEDGDMLLENVTVALVEGPQEEIVQIGLQGEEKVAAITKTDKNGKYQFRHVEIDKLKDYRIVFEYNGMSYQVVPEYDNDTTQKTNKGQEWYGQKGSKVLGDRSKFENRFETITNNNANGTQPNGQNGNLSIKYDKGDHESILNLEGNYQFGYEGQNYPINGVADKYIIQSATNELNKLREADIIRQNSETTITNLNLGVYERERPDLFLTNDIRNARVSIRGYEHVYEYGQRFKHRDENPDEFYQVGVKFGQKYGTAYTQPIYRADYSYENGGNSDELKVYLTQQIALTNQSTEITTRVNSIVDYFDIGYKVNAVGTGVDNRGNVSGGLEYREDEYNGQFKKLTVNTNVTLEPQKEQIVYIQFELTRQKIAEILNSVVEGEESRNLNNIAEINSYSSTKDGKIYSGIDKHSNPGNAVPGDVSTYENDTDKAPDIKLKVSEARSTNGTVFLDATSEEIKEGQERLGDGEYTNGEAQIPDVEIRIIDKKTNSTAKVFNETTKQWQDAVATSDGNGGYNISGLTPSEYEIQYIWKNGIKATNGEEITVQDYKGTIYKASRDQNNKYWYKEQVEKRYTDAIDRWDDRQEIDNELTKIKHDTTTTKEEMTSITPLMEIKIEYKVDDITEFGETIEQHNINNIDFGIVERPRQNIKLIKDITKVSFKLASGQTLSEAIIDSNGDLKGNMLVHMKASPMSNPKNGFVKIEMDNELLQGARLEVEYTIQVKNISELDYNYEGYYTYGTIDNSLKNSYIVKLAPSKIIDYLSSDVSYNELESRNNNVWNSMSAEEFRAQNSSTKLVAEEVITDGGSKYKERKILITEKYNTPLKPGETKSIGPTLYIEKMLTASKEIFITGNEAEIIEVEKNGGRSTLGKNPKDKDNHENVTIPGNYIPGKTFEEGTSESDDDIAEQISVTPTTGANRNNTVIVATGIIALIIVGVGAVIIKKKVLD